MDETEELINSIGLLLTQTRFARRALEDIERETANYGTFAFTSVIAAGPRFGAPPLFDGALRVHVVNINDLAPGSGFGGLISGLLGGAGSLVGNLVAGLFGGTISTPMLLLALPTIDSIAMRVARILELLGFAAPTSPATATADAPVGGAPVAGSNLTTMLESIKHAVNGLTALFQAANGQPDAAAKTSTIASTPEGDRWRVLLDSTTTMLTALSRVVDGLVIVLPVAIGAISWLISRLGALRVAIAETLQFALRNALLLRGAVLVTVFDTLAVIARIAARAIELLATTLTAMLSAIFDTVKEALLAVLALGATVGDAIKTTIDALLDWLIPTIDTVLRNLGDTRAFRVLTHVVRILPAILPVIWELKNDASYPDPTALNAAAAMTIPGLSGTTPAPGTPGGPPRPAATMAPDFGRIIESYGPRVVASLDRIEQVTRDGVQITGDTAREGLRNFAGQLDAATRAELTLSDTKLAADLGTVRTRSATLAESLIVPENAGPETGLEAIANAYEGWLTNGGLDTLMGTITRHFQGEGADSPVLQKVAEGSFDRPRATIQIDEVVIELAAPSLGDLPAPGPDGTLGPGDFPLPPEGDDIERYARMWRDYRMRGGRAELLPALA